MRTKQRHLNELLANPANPRADLQPGDPEYDKIRESIKAHGLVEPLVVNSTTGRIVSGHQRAKVLADLGYKTATVVEIDVDDTTETRIGVALNKIEGHFDDAKLVELIGQLTEHSTVELTHLGYTADEFDDLIRRLDQANATGFLDDLITDDEADDNAEPEIQYQGGDRMRTSDWYALTYIVTGDERAAILDTLRHAQREHGHPTFAKALTAIATDFLDRTGGRPASTQQTEEPAE